MRLKYLILIIFLIGCNGEIEYPSQQLIIKSKEIKSESNFTPIFGKADPVKKEDLKIELKSNFGLIKEKPESEPELDMEVSMINLDIGFREVGHYKEDGCDWIVYKKKYQVSWLYIHESCVGKRIKFHMER